MTGKIQLSPGEWATFLCRPRNGHDDQAPPSGPRERLWLPVRCARDPGFAWAGRGGMGMPLPERNLRCDYGYWRLLLRLPHSP
jgi:hypothetical protein